MAERRMFSKSIVNSARFLRMSETARLLYFDLGVRADDDGIVEAFSVMRTTGAVEAALDELSEKGFVTILNEDFVTHIIDWKRNNYIQKDRYHPSMYAHLLTENRPECDMDTACIHSVSKMDTQSSLGQVSLGEVSLGESSLGQSRLDGLTEDAERYFKDVFERFPTGNLKVKISQAFAAGLTMEGVKQAIDKTHERRPQNPSAYTAKILDEYIANGGEPSLSPQNQCMHDNDPIDDWERGWMLKQQQRIAQREKQENGGNQA